VSSRRGELDGEGGVFSEQLSLLEAVVELSQHPVEKVALSGCVPIPVSAPSPMVGFGAR